MDIVMIKEAAAKSAGAAQALIVAGEKYELAVAEMRSTVAALEAKRNELSRIESVLEAARIDLQTVQSQYAQAKQSYDAFVASLPQSK